MNIALRGAALTLALGGFMSHRAQAQDAPASPESPDPGGPVISFQSENDLYGDAKDRWVTNGFRLSFAYPAENAPKAFSWVRDLMPGGPALKDTDVVFAVGQSMFTPADITVDELIVDDRPYAGWLFLELGVSSNIGNRQDTLTVSVGVTGPPSLAKRAQTFVHTLTDSPEPQGWEFQLDTEVTAQAFYERAWFIDLLDLGLQTRVDISPRFGGNLGTVFIDANAGVVLRLGNYLPHALPPRLNPSATGSGRILRGTKGGAGWYIFGGVEGRAVARNLFLDGNTFESSHSVAKEEFVYEIVAGAVLSLDRFALSYSFVHRTKEFELQPEGQSIGAINLSIVF